MTGLLFTYSLLGVSRANIGGQSSQVLNGTVTYKSRSTLSNCTAFVDNGYLLLYSYDIPREAALLTVHSFPITLINIACICLMAVLVLLIKNIVSLISDDEISRCVFFI